MQKIRKQRVENQIQQIISLLIVQGEIKNKNVNTFVSITKVEVSGDKESAKVFVNSFEKGAVLNRSIEGLNKAKGFIQSKLARNLQLKNTPKLEFLADTISDDVMKMHNLLDKIKEERTQNENNEEE